VPNLFAKAGLSTFVAKLAASYVAKFAIMASFGTLLNAASGLVNTCVLGAMKLGSYAYLMAKIALIRTFPLVLTVGLPLILYYCHMLFGSTAVLISLANTILFAIDNCFGQTTFGRLPLRVFQGALTIAEIPFRLIYSLLRAKKFSDVIGILKSELASIPGNKLRILQRQQIQFQGLEAAKLNDGEMADVKAALAIAGASRGEDGEDHERLKSALNKRGLTLIDSLEASGGDNLTESSHGALARFLDNLKLNKNFYFLNGIITTDSGMQATVAYDPAAKVLRIFYHGTDFKPTCRGVKTIAADVQIVFSTSAAKKMADDATRLLELARDAFGDDKCRAVGHSLGGGLCQIACARTKVRGISINPAPVNEDFFARLNADNLKFAQDECIQISLQGDVLSNALVTRNGGCVQLFGRKINFPYSGFDNQHEAAVAEEALNQILLMEQNRALSDSERLEELNERISLLENRISEARGEMQRLNTLTNIRDRNNRQRQLQAEITNHENMLQSLTQERNRIERAARKAIGDVEVQLNKWHQNLARSIRESIDGDES
jgi:pimeloyl-ACP methyl ester carboxylesterase